MSLQSLQSLLVEAEQAGAFYITASDLGPLQDAAGALGLCCVDVDLEGCADKPELMRRFAQAFDIPDGFGHNWDALADSLGDLSWLPAEGYVLGVVRAAGLRLASPDDYASLVSVLEGASLDWRGQGRPFWCFIAVPDDQFDALQG
jgi:RNAse (barnase) inhibitor barstar